MKELFVLTCSMAIIFAIIFGAVVMLGSKSCDIKGSHFEDYRYSLYAGCIVKHNGKFVPLENLRIVD